MMNERWRVTLVNSVGAVVSTADFATEPEAFAYMREIGGTAEMDPPAGSPCGECDGSGFVLLTPGGFVSDEESTCAACGGTGKEAEEP